MKEKKKNRPVHEGSLDSKVVDFVRSMVVEIVRLSAENAALVRQTASSATAFPTDRGDAAASRGLTKLEWMAGMVESGNVGINGPVLSVHDVVRRAAHILAECRDHEAGLAASNMPPSQDVMAASASEPSPVQKGEHT
jgi:hypothetical protein